MEVLEIEQGLKPQLLFTLMNSLSQQLEVIQIFTYMMLKELKFLPVLREHYMDHHHNQVLLELLQKSQIQIQLNLVLMLNTEMFMMELLIDLLKHL